MAGVAAAAPESREIRVFLSSTFRDFNEERKLLATRVFPRLNREARKRGVELVEVDLRWGVTQQQAEDGHALEICLQEIERCKPYFIGMLGDSYGSLTPSQRQLLQAAPSLLEERQWLDGRIGEASYTELEIEHSLQLLRDPAIAGKAFYFRDPGYSTPKADAGEAGWRSDTPEDRQKLELLRQRIRDSGFPRTEGLKDPQAVVDQIEKDLWALIDKQFPEAEQPNVLQKEAHKHADYRRSRTGTGQYVGGQGYTQQVERWLEEGQQQILITGESGAGKSALIANWMEAHHQSQPDDVIYAHHLGCTNDANGLRPLLGRLIDTASAQLLEAELITEALAVPKDWWELVAKVAETLQSIGRWCQQQGKCWIWVLDGLDRLDPDDQQALPWLPQTLPAGIHVVASALACPARTILSERSYSTLTIVPLATSEQEQLIQRYLQRYTKELDGGLSQQILSHKLAGSPLFLKVLLEELRQCGRHDTLKEQLNFYLSSETIDDLYERVLERLENNGSGEAVRKVMTAIWASRAGLAETELLEITDLAPLQWAPIDLALEKSFGRNGNRLVFDHDFLRIAVQDRYLPKEEARRQAHSDLADWHEAKDEWDERMSEELPWQLKEADRLNDLRDYLLTPSVIASLRWDRGSREAIVYWDHTRIFDDGELDDLIALELNEEIERRRENVESLRWLIDQIADVLAEAGLYRKLLLNLRSLSLELAEASVDRDEGARLLRISLLAQAHRGMGNYDTALLLYQRCLEARESLLGAYHPDTLTIANNIANVFLDKGDYSAALPMHMRCLEARKSLFGPKHPSTLVSIGNIGMLHLRSGNHEEAERFLALAANSSAEIVGESHPATLTYVSNLGLLYLRMAKHEEAEAHLRRCLELRCTTLGHNHPDTNESLVNLAGLFSERGEYATADAMLRFALEADEKLFGFDHPSTIITARNLADMLSEKGDYNQAHLLYKRCLETSELLLGPEHPSTLTTVGNLGLLYSYKGDYEQAEAYLTRCLETSERLLGPEHPDTLTTVNNLGLLYSYKGDYGQAEAYLTRCLEARERRLGQEHPSTLTTVGNLGLLYSYKGDYEQAEAFYTRDLEASERLLGPEHPSTLMTVGNLGLLYSDKGDYEQAEAFYTRCLEARERLLGPEHPDTLTTVANLGILYRDKGDYELAEAYLERALEAQERRLGPEHPNTNNTRYFLANQFSDQERYDESIPLRRLALEVAATRDGRDAAENLTAINRLAIDLRETGELEEAEALFRELVAARQQGLEPGDLEIGRALGGLAKTLEVASKLQEALTYNQQALEHRQTHEGPDAWWTNLERFYLARVLQKLGRISEARALLQELMASMGRNNNPDDHDRQLISDAAALRRAIETGERQ